MENPHSTGNSIAESTHNHEFQINDTEAVKLLEKSVFSALETYSNVHRGSGYNSVISEILYERAREIVLEFLGLDRDKYVVIFCSPGRAEILTSQIDQKSWKCISSLDISLAIGLRALAVERNALPAGPPIQTGGGTTRLVSPGWVIWAGAPGKFEAGTPAVINVIAFARALQLIRQFGKDIFQNPSTGKFSASDILYHDELDQYSGQALLDELRKTQIGRNILVPTMEGLRPQINFDNAASTPAFAPVWNAFRQTWRLSGRIQQEIADEVRIICSGLLNAPLTAYDMFFTSNATEALNMAAESFSRESEAGIESVVMNSLLEHSSNELPWRMVPNSSLVRLKIDAEGFIDLNELDTMLGMYNQKGAYGNKRIRLVALTGTSNVLGTCNDLEGISHIVHRQGARLLVDAA
jgi:selenocysteine lyase/cysteine desulfurase